MYGRITTLAFVGIEARPVEVEARITNGQHNFAIVGLPWTRITVNLAPADLPKEGSRTQMSRHPSWKGRIWPTSRARRLQSARSRSRRPAATTFS
jgi:hypothetical protein